MKEKDQDRLEKLFEGATPRELGDALLSARHVLAGTDGEAKKEAALVVEYINSLKLDDKDEKQIIIPKKIRVKCKKFTHVDGVAFSPDQEGELTPKQFSALSRFFTRIAAVAVLFCLLAKTASAQTYRITAISNAVYAASLNGGTNNIPTNGLLGTNIVTATQIRHFCVQANFKLTSAGTAGVLITEYHSGDGTNYETTGITKNITAAGTALVTGTIERTNGIAGYYRYDILNSNAAPVTNLQFLLINPGVKGL